MAYNTFSTNLNLFLPVKLFPSPCLRNLIMFCFLKSTDIFCLTLEDIFTEMFLFPTAFTGLTDAAIHKQSDILTKCCHLHLHLSKQLCLNQILCDWPELTRPHTRVTPQWSLRQESELPLTWHSATVLCVCRRAILALVPQACVSNGRLIDWWLYQSSLSPKAA